MTVAMLGRRCCEMLIALGCFSASWAGAAEPSTLQIADGLGQPVSEAFVADDQPTELTISDQDLVAAAPSPAGARQAAARSAVAQRNHWAEKISAGPSRWGRSSGIVAGDPRQRFETETSNQRPGSEGLLDNLRRVAARGPAAKPSAASRRPAATQAAAPRPSQASAERASVAAEPSAADDGGHAAENGGAEHLLAAHELAAAAKSQANYSLVVQNCAAALRGGLDDPSRNYALSLSAWAFNRRGQLRLDEGQTDLAAADFDAAVRFDPQCWRAYHNRSVLHAQAGRFAEAFDDVCRVVQINPQFAKAFANRATLYVQAGNPEQALADYDRALELEPTLLSAQVGRGRLCHSQGRLDEALVSLSGAIELSPADADIRCSRADLLADLGRYLEAMQDYAQAIDLNPRCEHAYRNGAWLLATCPDAQVRDAEGAVAGAKKALECGYGERHAALDTLAAALANAHRYEEAAAVVQQAIEVAPEEVRVAYQTRLLLYESGQPFRTEPVVDVKTAEYVVGD